MLHTGLVYSVLTLSTGYFLWNFLFRHKATFPTIGPSGSLSSYVGAVQFLTQARRMVHDGYQTYPGRIFRVPLFTHWTHVVSGRGLTLEVGTAPDTELSAEDAINEIFQIDYTMGADLRTDPYHVGVIRGALTRNLARQFGDVRDEVSCAFDDVLALEGAEWKEIPVYAAMLDIVCRTSNRLFVGLPLCRSPEWIALNTRYTIDVAVAGQLIRMLPKILRPIFGPFLTSRKRNLRQAVKLLGPLVEKRLRDSTSSDNDLISWLLAASSPEKRTVISIVERVLAINFAAINTSSMAFTHALFDLAAHPEYIISLREEVARVVSKEGWTKAALGKMHKIDSFLRESQRMNGIGILVMPRRVANPAGFRFSDGTVVPHGMFLEVAAMEVHHDKALYDAPDIFDGFRSSRMRDENQAQPERSVFKHHMVTTSVDYLPFGHGRHACPGRFFAATELKMMLAHLVANYDVKLDSVNCTRPADQSVGATYLPNTTAKVWFTKRSEVESDPLDGRDKPCLGFAPAEG
ncbi:cytochrome P450 [Mycena leptocephala]|nr:cytochrome P450 [Mycena leptocephala]